VTQKLPTLPARLRPLVEEMSGSRIRAVSESAFGKTGLIPLWFGESDRVTPPFVSAAAKAALDAGHTFYTPNRGVAPLREAVAGYVSRLRKSPVDVERVTITASGVNAIMLVMQTIVDPGDNVVLVTPLWPNCADAVIALNGDARRASILIACSRNAMKRPAPSSSTRRAIRRAGWRNRKSCAPFSSSVASGGSGRSPTRSMSASSMIAPCRRR
jgi:hypothetical protein